MNSRITHALALCSLVFTPGFAGASPVNGVLQLDGKTAGMTVADSPSFHSISNAMTLELRFRAASYIWMATVYSPRR